MELSPSTQNPSSSTTRKIPSGEAIRGVVEDALANPLFAAAVEVARNRLPVYPARPRGKAPLHRGWQHTATTKVEHLAKRWCKAPAANVGVACRGYAVLDADSKRGEGAVADLGLPPTTTVRTRRGAHYYFAGNAPTVAGVLPDVELRGRGSGVLAAGSVHPTGFEYTWEIPPWEVAPIPLPEELSDLIARNKGGERTGTGPHFVLEGGRTVHLLRVAGSLRGHHGIGELAPVLHSVNEVQCLPPLPPERVEQVVRDADNWPPAPAWVVNPTSFCTDPRLSPKARIVLRLLCDHANAEGQCFPGIRRLATLAGMRCEAVVKATYELERAERIKVRRSRRGNRYRLLPWTPGSFSSGSASPSSSSNAAAFSHTGGLTARSSVPTGGTTGYQSDRESSRVRAKEKSA